jgi:hypothetical protein
MNGDGDLSGFLRMDEMLMTAFRGKQNIAVFLQFTDELFGCDPRKFGTQAATSITVRKDSAGSEGTGSPAFFNALI